MSEGPKLYTNKPKKAQRKQYQQQQASAPSSITSSGSQAPITPPPPPPPTPPPPPQPPKESFARRYKFLWPLLLAVNFTVGAYLFTRTKKKDVGTEEAEFPDVPSTPVSTSPTIATVTEKSPTPPVVEHGKLLARIPEDQQHELFKWMLEERRRVKPTDPEEKKRIDEEKAILKQFIRTKSVPSL